MDKSNSEPNVSIGENVLCIYSWNRGHGSSRVRGDRRRNGVVEKKEKFIICAMPQLF